MRPKKEKLPNRVKQLLLGSKLAALAEYWKHLTAGFDGVHALGYNSAETEPIWMQSAAL